MKLIVCLDGRAAGLLEGDGSRAGFVYSGEWLNHPAAYPLSNSLPLRTEAFTGQPVLNFLWGLLPDNERILTTWSKWFHVSARNPLALLHHVGEDCAGAVQFVTEDRLDAVLESGKAPGQIEWLDDNELEARIRQLVRDGAAGRNSTEGQFSLAGAQSKTAFYFDSRRKRWGIPRGRTPTTHILKPVTNHFDGFAENEHFCLQLAQRMGLPAAHTQWQSIGGVPTIVVQRYDRVQLHGQWRRIHQEDCCQALGIHPDSKYESDGGPGFVEIMGLLTIAGNPQIDRQRLMKTAIFTWLMGATDAHAKNFSVLHGNDNGQPTVRLAPLYDIASAWPYTRRLPAQKMKLAMRIGGHYRIREILPRHFHKLALACGYSTELIMGDLEHLTDRMPDEAAALLRDMAAKGMARDVLSKLMDGIAAQCRLVQQQFKAMAGK